MQATIHKADNLDILKKLPDNTIDLIYCDILYGTGRNFTDYQDLKADRKIIEEHYEPRLREMHRVLKDTGSIYLQMDTRINHWLRVMMDRVWGYDNFRNEIIWCYSNGGKSVNNFAKKHDIIYWYSKTNDYKFNHENIKIPYELISPKSTSPFNMVDNNGRRYRKRKSNGKVYVYYEDEGKVPNDWWLDVQPLTGRYGLKEKLNYPTQKPKALLERIIKASSNEGDLVADFYAGSHTTGEVACELGRRYIGVDIGERSYEIGQERLKKWL